MTRAARLFEMVDRLRAPHGCSVEGLAREFEVSPRTIFRDLAALEERGLPLGNLGGRYRINDAAAPETRVGGLDSSELAIVRLALAAPSAGQGGPIARRVARLVAKLDGLLGGGSRAGEEMECVLIELDRLARAGRTARIRYLSFDGQETAERELDPWKVFHRGGAWWVIGRCHLENAPRFFRLERVVEARATGRRFRPPADLDLERLFRQAWSAFDADDAEPRAGAAARA